MSDTGKVESFYDSDPEYEWHRLERHRTEYAVTLCALAEYLPPSPATILDIGGGPGRYSIELAASGYTVTLFDLSQNLLTFAQSKAAERGVTLADTVHGSATDLGMFKDASFDAVLLMGPLYHLLAQVDRACAVQEATRVLKPGGILFASFIARYAAIRDLAIHAPEDLPARRALYEQILASGTYEADERGGFIDAYFTHPSEIEPLFNDAGFTKLDMIGCEGVVSMIEEKVNALTGEAWDQWVEINYRLGKDPCTHGLTGHLLYVGRK